MDLITLALFILILGQRLFDTEDPWVPKPRDAPWLKRHEMLVNTTIQHRNDEQIVFIGDSITDFWNTTGLNVWNQYYIPRHAYNYGIGGDKTQNVLYRIENGELDGLNAKVVVLMIGSNNLILDSNEDIAHGVNEILNQIFIKINSTKIILLGVLPRDGPFGSEAKQLNILIEQFGDNNRVFWLDMWSEYTNADGSQKIELYGPDKVHLNLAGYTVWYNYMEPLLSDLYSI